MKTKLIPALVCLGVVVTIAGCASSPSNAEKGRIQADRKLTISRVKRPPYDPPSHAYANRTVTAGWTLNQGIGPGFAIKVSEADTLITWGTSFTKDSNFAIVVPSTNHWEPTNGCSWAACSSFEPWPMALPNARGEVSLRFLPGSAKINGEFHYKIAIFGKPGRAKVFSEGETFPDDSDDDIVDTTIIWGGGRPP